MLLEISILFSLLFLFLYGRMFYCRFTLPPGPIPLPIFGNLLHINKRRPYYTIQKWSKKHGPVFTIWIANAPIVVITDYDIMKDALTKHGDQLLGKSRPYSLDVFTRGNFGILSSDGYIWREQRRFSAKNLHNFGMGRSNIMDEKILINARNLSDSIIEEMNSQRHVIIDLHQETARCVCSIMATLVFGHGYAKGDHKFTTFQRTVEGTIKLLNTLPILLMNSWPWLRHIPLFGHFGTDEFMKVEKTLREYLVSEIEIQKEEMKNRLDKDVEPQNLVEAYLKELKRREDSGEDMSSFSDWQLVPAIMEILMAGMLTTTNTLRWGYIAMVEFPHVQQKVFEEIDHVIGRDRSPSMSDRSSMPFVMATLNEIQRWRNINPINFTRTNETDFMLGGYKIPKNTDVIPQISALAIDEKVFPSPEMFIPERFLEDDGKTFKKINQFAPFSIGKRQCMGEGLAKADLFLIFVHMMQHFELVLPPGAPKTSIEPCLGISAPEPFQVLVKLR